MYVDRLKLIRSRYPGGALRRFALPIEFANFSPINFVPFYSILAPPPGRRSASFLRRDTSACRVICCRGGSPGAQGVIAARQHRTETAVSPAKRPSPPRFAGPSLSRGAGEGLAPASADEDGPGAGSRATRAAARNVLQRRVFLVHNMFHENFSFVLSIDRRAPGRSLRGPVGGVCPCRRRDGCGAD